MDLLLFASSIASFIYLAVGLYVFLINYKERIHQLFLIMCFSLAAAAFSVVPVLQSDTGSEVNFWVKFGFYGLIAFFSVVIHLFILLILRKKINRLIVVLIYLPAIYLFYKNCFYSVMYKDFYKVNGKWEFVLNTNISEFYFYIAFAIFSLFTCIALIFIWGIKNNSKKIRTQSLILITGFSLTFLIALIAEVILPLFTGIKFFGFSPVWFLILIFSIFICIVKYRFMGMSDFVLSKDIISNIDEILIFTDNSLNILSVNKKSVEALNVHQNRLIKKNLSEIIYNFDSIKSEIDKLRKNEKLILSARIFLTDNAGNKILADAKLSCARDRYNDNLGILILAREVWDFNKLKKIYGITGREAELIQCILNGLSNKKIAHTLDITERTVKAHITSILAKIGINSRVQLLKLMNDLNLNAENKENLKNDIFN